MSILIEHTAGAFPLWLAPVQIAILPVGATHETRSREVFETLRKENFRALLETDESLGKRIRKTKVEKIPYALVIGDKEIESETVSVESRNEGALGALAIDDFLDRIRSERSTRM